MKRAVHERNGGACGYVDEQGRRCSERVRLEFHHRYPFGRGGDHFLSDAVAGDEPADLLEPAAVIERDPDVELVADHSSLSDIGS